MNHLPKFEGETPRGVWLSLSGTITDETSQPPEPFHLGDELVFVVRAEVVGVKHARKADGKDAPRVLIRQHIVSALEAHLVDYEILRDARIRTDEHRIELSGAFRLPLEPDPPTDPEPNPYTDAPPDYELLALGAGTGERVDPDVPDDVIDIDPDTGEIIARAPVPLTPKQLEALLFLDRHEEAGRRVRESNGTECLVATHLTEQSCRLYWQHVRALTEKGYATATDVDPHAEQVGLLIVLTPAGIQRAATEKAGGT